MARLADGGETRAAARDQPADLTAELRAKDREIAMLRARLDDSRAIMGAARELTAAHGEEQLVQTILERTIALFDLADGGMLALYDSPEDCLRVVACSQCYAPVALRIRMKPGEGAPGMTYLSQKPHLRAGPRECAAVIDSVNPDDRELILAAIESHPACQSLMCAPLVARGKVIGAIQLDHNADDRVFSERDRGLVSASEWYLQHMVAPAGIDARLAVIGVRQSQLSGWLATTLFRVTQEALTTPPSAATSGCHTQTRGLRACVPGSAGLRAGRHSASRPRGLSTRAEQGHDARRSGAPSSAEGERVACAARSGDRSSEHRNGLGAARGKRRWGTSRASPVGWTSPWSRRG